MLGCFVINLLNNKTIILLNLAEYRLILSIRRYSARLRRMIVKYCTVVKKACLTGWLRALRYSICLAVRTKLRS